MNTHGGARIGAGRKSEIIPIELSEHDKVTQIYLREMPNDEMTSFIRVKIEQEKFCKELKPIREESIKGMKPIDWNILKQTKLFNNPQRP